MSRLVGLVVAAGVPGTSLAVVLTGVASAEPDPNAQIGQYAHQLGLSADNCPKDQQFNGVVVVGCSPINTN